MRITIGASRGAYLMPTFPVIFVNYLFSPVAHDDRTGFRLWLEAHRCRGG
jgi:hypothetical protein